ncbi:hypothetical protein AVEN_205508-1 [Araneus ventricosus]|uniref:Secreted protein n=1 Tax=Araneus ventricosus TaxID=182803 RepID=A0A4Y2RW95_ARAVE|nr:hypothetical protein AVEN_205508-1 [Araneus ventricosus]
MLPVFCLLLWFEEGGGLTAGVIFQVSDMSYSRHPLLRRGELISICIRFRDCKDAFQWRRTAMAEVLPVVGKQRFEKMKCSPQLTHFSVHWVTPVIPKLLHKRRTVSVRQLRSFRCPTRHLAKQRSVNMP